jgi:hypothetical protein
MLRRCVLPHGAFLSCGNLPVPSLIADPRVAPALRRSSSTVSPIGDQASTKPSGQVAIELAQAAVTAAERVVESRTWLLDYVGRRVTGDSPDAARIKAMDAFTGSLRTDWYLLKNATVPLSQGDIDRAEQRLRDAKQDVDRAKHDLRDAKQDVDRAEQRLRDAEQRTRDAKHCQRKTVHYVEEDELTSRIVNEAAFIRWMDGNALVPLDAANAKHVATFEDVDESTIYCLSDRPLDVKACVQHLVDTHELEFGRACEQLIATQFPNFEVVKTTERSTHGKAPPANPYAYRLDSAVEVDFFAKNGTESVAGMFQLTMPKEKKIEKFLDNCKKLTPPVTKCILGVSLANPGTLQHLQHKFAAVLVRSATGFCKL